MRCTWNLSSSYIFKNKNQPSRLSFHYRQTDELQNKIHILQLLNRYFMVTVVDRLATDLRVRSYGAEDSQWYGQIQLRYCISLLSYVSYKNYNERNLHILPRHVTSHTVKASCFLFRVLQYIPFSWIWNDIHNNTKSGHQWTVWNYF